MIPRYLVLQKRIGAGLDELLSALEDDLARFGGYLQAASRADEITE
jgi:hypothetical protein